MIIYSDNKRNHVIIPGREKELENFLNSSYKGVSNKPKKRFVDNSRLI